MKNAICPNARVIMMKHAPRVRRHTTPVAAANSAEAPSATGSEITASLMPWAARMPTA